MMRIPDRDSSPVSSPLEALLTEPAIALVVVTAAQAGGRSLTLSIARQGRTKVVIVSWGSCAVSGGAQSFFLFFFFFPFLSTVSL